MLAMADHKGRVWGSIPGLANRARVSLQQCENALFTFKSPDKYSRTTDNEGRRIEDIDGGWLLLNYEKHRAIRDDESVKESKRKYINSRREAERKASTVENVDQCRSDVDTSRQVYIEEEVEVEVEESKPLSNPDGFDEFWSAYPKKVGKGEAKKLWAKLKVNGRLPSVLSAIAAQKATAQWQKEGGQFIPLPATWLRQGRWDDEVQQVTPQWNMFAGAI
jgi:hypothetical protein